MASSCSKCSTQAVTFVRYSGQHLCRDHFLRFFDQRAKMEVSRQGKLPRGRVAVALSGGKDSVAVLHFLHRLASNRPDVDLVALTVDEGIAGYRDGSLEICRQVTDDLGVPWHVVKTRDLAGYDIDDYAGGGGKDPSGSARAACGPCGVFRRAGINGLAREVGAKAVATGHNLDDQAQTVLMNVLNGDVERLARLAPHDDPVPGLVPRILPFRTIPEKEVLLYGILHDLPLHHDEECPYAARAQRFFLRDMLWKLEERTPGTRHSLARFQERLKPVLVDGLERKPAAACPVCGEPTSSEGGASCKTCSWKL